MKYIVIGISNNPAFVLTDEIKELLPLHKIFSGGRRHYELIQQHLPSGHQWIDIKSEMGQLFAQYKQLDETIVVFASGDPLFYGFANTIKKFHPEAALKVYPHFNSLQVLCHRSNIDYRELSNTSVHGRTWDELDTALISQKKLIGVLTDGVKNPASIAERLLEYGFDNYRMIVGEALEGPQEVIRELSLTSARDSSFHTLNCVLLVNTFTKHKALGIADDQFSGLENRPNMITKMPIRLVSLSQLDLYNRTTFWDIGFCTGSVCIEAKKQFPALQVTAFEKRPECSELFDMNTRRHCAPGITKVMGDIFSAELPASVDAVFIGGHGNRLLELILLIDKHLVPKGRLVMNAVKVESKEQFIAAIAQLDYHLQEPVVITVDDHNPITILTAEKN
ncbi:precorrin-6Y C5,15-methyltransferase (decarboxylating) [Chitinophaga sp. CF118]|uniref:precorrin-6y C5,15-methyltransferase (decarboxylating) subunit CbiE n=1 Tax=Chitinophaga sp. CF118 TaxID=1884367 RepID=UPI0008E156E6|nr:precorrin-6y C5,15-methyltransferase (decarboxylating) subunit CbiE [Chitinophaga sp. CF118]SFD48303.1 precorrin-6Y C5,15-methyltransferase (decarboxylating) [Chitinophaga sp. CF118]